MTTLSQPSNPASAFAAAVGRYFTAVSVVPSLILVTFVLVLVRSGAWTREPDFGEGIRALTQLGLGGTFALILAGIAFGVVLHPLQFLLVQVLEGYWGVRPFWAGLRANRVSHHVRRRNDLQGKIIAEDQILDRHAEAAKEHLKSAVRAAKAKRDGRQPEPVVIPPGYLSPEEHAALVSSRTATHRLWSIYPKEPSHIMPTRLGNVLRHAEDHAGEGTGLRILEFAPHLMMVAPREHRDYVDDQGTSMDLAVNSCLVFLLGFFASVVFLWPHGLWLLVALVPLGLAWLCYEGAVTAAQGYGSALRMVLDLNRFALYEQMHLPIPLTTEAERETVKDLKKLSSEPSYHSIIRYRRQPAPPTE